MTVSFLGGMSVATSSLTRRRRCGAMAVCSWCTCSWVVMSPYRFTKSFDDLNFSGSMKFSSDHSSSVLFCSGVPVMSTRMCWPWYSCWPASAISANALTSLASEFFSRCASSTTTLRHGTDLSSARSLMSSSYVVIKMLKFTSGYLRLFQAVHVMACTVDGGSGQLSYLERRWVSHS